MYDLIAEYFPDLEEIEPSQLATARASVVNYLRPHFSDLEMSPGSVFGDMFVSPAAAFLAAISVSQNRFMSDLDLRNVADGVIYSCNFVEAYLGNFAVRDTRTLQSSGLVRLSFSADASYLVNRGARFSFNGELFYPRLPSLTGDDLVVLPSGSIPVSSNEIALAQTSDSTWAVDIPVTGKMTKDVARYTSGLSSLSIPQLIGVAAAVTFDYGLPSTSLRELAETARRTAYAASVGSRNSTRNFVVNQWPETKTVAVAVSGDPELQRTTPGSAMALAAPAADIYFRSRRDYQEEAQTVRLSYDNALRRFRGRVTFLHRPSKLLDVKFAGDVTLNLPNCRLYSRVLSDRLPGSTGCGTAQEEFWLDVIPPEKDEVILIPRTAAVIPYALFTVRYLTDPLLEAVSAMLTATDNAPVGVDVVVKTGPMVDISSLTLSYRRKPGVTVALTAARNEIATYINGVGWPELFSEAAMVETMYAAGALRTQDISCVAKLNITPASRRFAASVIPEVTADWDAVGVSLDCPSTEITTLGGMRVNQIVQTTINGVAELYAVSDVNVRYHILPENIKFIEVK